MMVNRSIIPDEEKEWENPKDPEAPSDQRDKEQMKRQYEDAKQNNDNLTKDNETDKKLKS
jgi:hypothetical protein